MHDHLAQLAHRPWPLPRRRWTWRQSWCDLLFAHWPVPVAAVRPLVPAALEIDEHDGTSWVGVVPFRMEGVMRRPWPDLPWVSAFPELNVRVYVTDGTRPGVWFLSLDATNRLAVWCARRFFHLPYHAARMRLRATAEGVEYESVRSASDDHRAFTATYGPADRATAETRRAQPGTLEHWLTERYCLYARAPTGRVLRTEVHHAPWPLQDAEAHITRNEMIAPHGLTAVGPPPVVHFARRVDVLIWPPEAI